MDLRKLFVLYYTVNYLVMPHRPEQLFAVLLLPVILHVLHLHYFYEFNLWKSYIAEKTSASGALHDLFGSVINAAENNSSDF